tara:strand:+ start:71 stop:250 length:180 start_codon:yes stop_codon:yes gene_type:complete
MSNPMKRRKLHRAALAARGEVKETPVAAPVAAPVVTEVIENVPPVSRARVNRKNAEGSE